MEEQASLKSSPGISVASEPSATVELLHALAGPPVIVALFGFFVAWWCYIRRPALAKRFAESLRGLHTLLLNKFYVDEMYAALFVRPLLWISTNVFWHAVDEEAIDGTVNGVARVARELGGQLRGLQSGNTRSYATWVIVGAVGFTVLLLGLLGIVVR